MHAVNVKVKEAQSDIKEIHKKLDNFYENKEESKKHFDPRIDEEKKKFEALIEEQWARKRKAEDDYDASWDKYED